MILTVTINPAIDHNLTVDRLVFEDRSYILSSVETAGGRGINASRVIQDFGGATLALLPSGGKAGVRLEALLRKEKFPVEVVRIKQEIRTNLTITDRNGLTAKLNEQGPVLSRSAVQQVEKAVRQHLPRATWLMLCGSVPPHVSASFYPRLIQLARKQKVPVLLDTDNEALLEGVEARPTVVAPNQQEAERLLNRALLTRTHYLEAAERILHMGAESVLLSLGSRGVVAINDKGLWEVRPPRIEAVSPIGAGDAMCAAFVWARAKGLPFVDSARWGVAAGTASALLPGLQFATLPDVERTYAQVEVRAVR